MITERDDRRVFFIEEDLDLKEFREICHRQPDLESWPLAGAVEEKILIYEGEALRRHLAGPDEESCRQELKTEWARCLKEGPGVFALRGAYSDLSVIDRSTELFDDILAKEKAEGGGEGDHFGANERIWNSKQKVCLRDPELFVDYYGNPFLALACESWLGPCYQVTAQVNNVKPGGQAQSAHRDYHLGFQTAETVSRFPAHAQVMSQFLTLQGAIAHGDMPLSSGPTLFLPYSQIHAPGYLACRDPAFVEFFDQHRVQIPFQKGDMVFFNPALFHGAGTNIGEVDRMANLLQISSAFGRTMESLDTHAMIRAVYPVLQKRLSSGVLTERHKGDCLAAVADGYAFPTNLDSDPPLGGNAPGTDLKLMEEALESVWPMDRLMEALAARFDRRMP
ncbi:MAG: phytanoyl-CoA dioxygenase family protein [Verrucomicrobiota bacterium]